ncbi:uncharacterized protein LOC132544437 [Ylistrum balloti]|uniref:uncharacterized protein LOC132544437 n=1 Tax=Ylistrum balloti TaxID=509963 RepID=UPI002905E933|nr:uncharacterized protein LOC132544437 [Ylistrum balloti]
MPPSDAVLPAVNLPQLRPCGPDDILCGSPRNVDSGLQSPCGPGLSPCDSFTPDISVPAERLPPLPCGPINQPCGSELPCKSETQLCMTDQRIPTVVEEFPLPQGCMDSECIPSFQPEATDDRQEWFPKFTDSELKPEPCISGSCTFIPETSPDDTRPFYPDIHNPDPCLNGPCFQGQQTPTQKTQFIEQTHPFMEWRQTFNVPTVPEVPRDALPCSHSGCQTGYKSQDILATDTKAEPCDSQTGCDSTSTDRTGIGKATEQTTVLWSALIDRLFYRLEPITGVKSKEEVPTEERNAQQQSRNFDGVSTPQTLTKVINVNDRSNDHNELGTTKPKTYLFERKVTQVQTETSQVAESLPVIQLDESVPNRPHHRRKAKRNRKNRRRRKNKRIHKKKDLRNGTLVGLEDDGNRNSTIEERNNTHRAVLKTTTPLPDDYTVGISSTVSSTEPSERRKSSFEDKIKSFLKEFNRLRGRQRNHKQTNRRQDERHRNEERSTGERRGQGRICRDDLCTSYRKSLQAVNEAITSKLCPPGYHQRIESDTVFCQEVGEEGVSVPIPVNNHDLMGVTERSTQAEITHNAISSTMDTRPSLLGVNTLTSVSDDNAGTSTPSSVFQEQRVICPAGQVAVNVLGGAICQYKDTETTTQPFCPQGQTYTRSGVGFICAAVGEIRPVCGRGTTLTQIEGRFVCEELTSTCASGQKRVLTSSGWRCRSITEFVPCPEGLEPIDTPVGRLCQYRGHDKILPPRCPAGQEPVQSQTGYTCNNKTRTNQASPRKCSHGFIPLETTDGLKCVKDPSLRFGMTSCPVGFIIVRGECKSVGITDNRGLEPCPLGQEAVLSDSGQVCQYRSTSSRSNNKKQGNSSIRESSPNSPDNLNNDNKGTTGTSTNDEGNRRHDSNRYNGNTITNCPQGQILTQKRSRFVCDVTSIDVTEWICSPREVIVQLTSELACVEHTQTAIVCGDDFELGWSNKDDKFTCLHSSTIRPDDVPMVTQPSEVTRTTLVSPWREEPCRVGEILLMDDVGRRCVVLQTNEGLCGDNYIVQTLENGQKICKSRTMKLKCPDGYELVTSGRTTECIPTGGSAVPLSPCEDNYSISNDGEEAECVLSSFGTDCSRNETDYCGRSLESLKMDCYPQCSNGGVCADGSCICPPGVTGVACHQDVDECQLLPRGHCQYDCRNTFGSYHCVCPAGRVINADGRTCNDVECTPECLNGGYCRAGTCYCAAGFEGTFCQTDIDECARHSGLCQHHCRNTHGDYACVCSPGSRLRQDGRTCVNTTCVPECRNGGVCFQQRCQCPRGYRGVTCQLDINECLEWPCSHICRNIPGSYVCACPIGYELNADRHTCSNLTITETY